MLARILAVLLTSVALTGCVERYLLVRSDPSDAEVFVDGVLVGPSPVDHAFTFYGRYEVIVRAPGHESARTFATVLPPWYQQFPIDFFVEFLVPWTVRDEHEIRFELARSPERLDGSLRDAYRERGLELERRGRRLEERSRAAADGEAGATEARTPDEESGR